jgi:transposase
VNGFPPSSPDLNPIESIFSIWDHNVCSRQPKTTKDLKQICEEEWKKINISHVRKAILKLRKVLEWVDEHDGEMYYE